MTGPDEPLPPPTQGGLPPSPPAPAGDDATVTPLVGAGSPADLGLSGLGLVMQLAGSLFAGLVGVMGLAMVISTAQANASLGNSGDSTITLWVLTLAAISVARSMYHRKAGTRLLYDGPGTPLGAVRRYAIVAMVQTLVFLAFLMTKGHSPMPIVITVGVALAAWPATLMILFSLPRYKRFEAAVPLPEDKGFEGAAILMLVFGLTGLGYGLFALYGVLQLPSPILSQLFGILMVLFVVMLVIRSSLHVVAGWRGVHEVHMDRAVESATRYADFGVVTGFVGSGAVLLMMMAGGGGAVGLLAIVLVGWMLLAWPLIIRKFFSERQFADLLADADGNQQLHRRAPDLGHSTLGWLLLALGVYMLALALPQAVFFHDAPGLGAGGRGMRDSMNPFAMMMQMMQSAGGHSPWWGVGTAALQVWAGLELIRMSDNHKVVTSIYGVVATGVAIYVNLPALEALGSLGMGGMIGGGAGGPLTLGTVAIAVILPVTSLVLVNRKLAPAAHARYRAAAPAPTPPAPAAPPPAAPPPAP